MTLEISRMVGREYPFPQFQTEVSSAPSRGANSAWVRSWPSRHLRRWSPMVFGAVGYPSGGSLGALNVTWQKGNAGMPLRLLHRPGQAL